MARASDASVLLVCTKGRTNFGCNKTTSWPSVLILRAHQCALPQASSATRPGACRLRYCIRSSRPNRRLTISPESLSTQCIWKTRFATSKPYVMACISGPPFASGGCEPTTLAHRATRLRAAHQQRVRRAEKGSGVHPISVLKRRSLSRGEGPDLAASGAPDR